MKKIAYAFITVLFATACGGGGSSVSIVGDTPEQQAETIADALCDKQVECRQATIDCETDPETQMLDCTGTFEDVDYDECVADNEPGILADFQNCELTAEEEAIVEDCVNALLAQPCISQAELDAYIAEIEAGNEPEEPREYPEACVETDAIFEACSTPQ